jgi:hypothetical protein
MPVFVFMPENHQKRSPFNDIFVVDVTKIFPGKTHTSSNAIVLSDNFVDWCKENLKYVPKLDTIDFGIDGRREWRLALEFIDDDTLILFKLKWI